MTTCTPETVERPANPPSARLIGSESMISDIRIKIYCDAKPFLRGIKNAQLILYQIHGWRRFVMPGYWMALLGIPNHH